MSEERRREKVRSAASQTVALAEARREMQSLRYGQREHSAPTARDISLGWGQQQIANRRKYEAEQSTEEQ